jgi:hypothetical protein
MGRLSYLPFPGSTLAVKVIFFAVLAAAILSGGCGDDSGTNSGGAPPVTRLAGGGRADNRDNFFGGPGDSGPNDSLPGIPGPEPFAAYRPLFQFVIDCEPFPQQQIIDDQSDWQAAWATAIGCLSNGSFPGLVMGDTLFDSLPPPEVDFSDEVVALISIEPSDQWGRWLYITDVTVSVGGSVISYTVMSPGDDCRDIIVVNGDTAGVIAAFAIPRPVPNPVTWIRTDSLYACTWIPDPNEPITLYYTDAECDLGANEQILVDSAAWQTWVEAAFACDRDRWGTWIDSVPGGDSGFYEPPDMSLYMIPVDFATHAVIILRADPQTRWGGGVWLNRYDTTAAGTTIDYSIMVPSEDCPEIQPELGVLRPTVAIRVLKPPSATVTWNRRVETITCDWPDSIITPIDSSGWRP